MEWKEEFSVGIPEIDAQHQALGRCIALVETAVTTKQQWSTMNSALAQLTDVVRIHFAVEESLMRIHGYPELGRHVGEHLQFVNQLRRLQDTSLRGDVSDDMVSSLGKWLRAHIVVSDKHYASCFPTVGIVTEVPIRANDTGPESACGAESPSAEPNCDLETEAHARDSEWQARIHGVAVCDFKMDGTIKAYLDGLVRSIKCSKDFACAKSDFETLCRARDVGLQSNLVCLEEDCSECDYRVKSDVGQFCQCPIRVYLGKALKVSPVSTLSPQ